MKADESIPCAFKRWEVEVFTCFLLVRMFLICLFFFFVCLLVKADMKANVVHLREGRLKVFMRFLLARMFFGCLFSSFLFICPG